MNNLTKRMKDMISKFNRKTFAPDGGTGGGSNPQQPSQNQQAANQQQQNNNGNNEDPLATLWAEDQQDTQTANQTQQNNQQQPQQPSGQDAAKQLDDFIGGFNFAEGIDQNELADKIKEGDLGALLNSMGKMNANTMKQTLITMNKMFTDRMNTAIEEGIKKAVNQTSANLETRDIIGLMESRIPKTKDPSIAPVAQGVLHQAMKKTKGDKEKAIGIVEAFFNKLDGGRNLNRPPSSPGDVNYAGNPQSSGGNDDIDWGKLLTETE